MRLLELFDDHASARDLELELATMVHVGERDGPLVLILVAIYERLSALAHAIAIKSYPNTEAKAQEHAAGNVPLYNQLVAQGLHYPRFQILPAQVQCGIS
jgi:hypothetical protein